MSFPAYEEYKLAGFEELGEVPEYWDVVRLKNTLATPITDGPHETPRFTDEGVRFLSVDGIQDGELQFEGCRCISQNAHTEYRKKALPQRDDILMGKAASTGKIARVKVDFEFSIWSPLALIRVKPDSFAPAFVEYCLKAPFSQSQIDNFCTSNTQKNISMGDIPKLVLPSPPLPEQRNIAAFLDAETLKIDGLVSEQRRLIELLKEKRQAVISHAVTKGLNADVKMKPSGIQWLGDVPEHWTPITVGNLVRQGVLQLQDGNHGESHPKAAEFQSSGIPFLMAADMDDGGVDLENCNFITEERAADLRIPPALAGDVLLSHKGNQLGEVAVIPNEINFPSVVLTPQITYYRVQERSLEKRFLYFFLQSQPLQSQLWYFAAVQATRPYVGLTAQRDLTLTLPPVDEQIEIADKLSTEVGGFDTLLAQAERAIELLQERRTALISAAVTGKIDVRGYAQTKQEAVA